MTTPPLDRVSHNHGPDGGPGLSCRTHPTGDCIIQTLTDRAESAEREASEWERSFNAERADKYMADDAAKAWRLRAEAAEAAVARVEALCKTTDGDWLDPEDECNNVGGILQAVRGDGA